MFFVENHFNRFNPLFLFVCLFRQSTTFDYNSAPIDSNYKNYDSEYPYKVSSYWCVVLRNQANRPESGITELKTCEEILFWSNRGYVVVVAWENTRGSKVDDSPHYATVYPFNNTNEIAKINLCNVSTFDKTGIKTVEESFGNRKCRFYVNKNQKFRDTNQFYTCQGNISESIKTLEDRYGVDK